MQDYPGLHATTNTARYTKATKKQQDGSRRNPDITPSTETPPTRHSHLTLLHHHNHQSRDTATTKKSTPRGSLGISATTNDARPTGRGRNRKGTSPDGVKQERKP